MSESYVASRDCTILGVDYKAGQPVEADMAPAYRNDLIEAGLIASKASAPAIPRPRAMPAKAPEEGAKE